jgi:hypothetical protein
MLVEELGLEVSEGDVVVKVYYTIQLSTGYWYKHTYNENGYPLTYKNSSRYWHNITRDEFGNVLTYNCSDGRWTEITRDASGNQLSYKSGNLNTDKK